MIQKLAWVFGIVLTLVGVLGFVPGITSKMMLLGIFHVDGLHNIIHLISGLAALAAARGMFSAQMYFKVFGVVYGLVAILGLIQGDTVLGLIGINMADNLLHIAIAALSLWAGFLAKPASMTMGGMQGAM